MYALPTPRAATIAHLTSLLHTDPPTLQVLLCDSDTLDLLTVCLSQRDLLSHGVVLVDYLRRWDRPPMPHLAAVVLCRPTPRGLEDLAHELSVGRYATYTLAFTTSVSSDTLHALANADAKRKVKRVVEWYVDVIPLTDAFALAPLVPGGCGGGAFGVGQAATAAAVAPAPLVGPQWDAGGFGRVMDGIVSAMLLMKRRAAVRYRAGSTVAQRLAMDLSQRMKILHAAMPDVRATEAVVVVVDRLDDPLTPLLMPWTYRAMIHELLGIRSGNTVEVDSNPDLPAAERVMLLSPDDDEFFATHAEGNWGSVAKAVQAAVTSYREASAIGEGRAKPESLADLQSVMTKLPQLAATSASITRHVNLLARMSAEIKSRMLYNISELEQQLLDNDAMTRHGKDVLQAVAAADCEKHDAVRLMLLYALRYEGRSGNILPDIQNELRRRGCAENVVQLPDTLLRLSGTAKRAHALFRSTASAIVGNVLSAIPGMGGDVRNVYTLHEPLLKRILARLASGELDGGKYPVAHRSGYESDDAVIAARPAFAVVFIAGGATLEEARIANQASLGGGEGSEKEKPASGGSQLPPMRVCLLSTDMINTEQFVASLLAAA